MKRPKGPELKMPELKVPGFLSDLYYDLRDRRLLPLIALVVVAIVATPILLGHDSEPSVPPPVGGAIQALKESGGQRTSSLVVVEADPGLRDYRKRLRGRTPLDPFRSPPKPSLASARLGKGKGADPSASFTSTSTTVKKTKTKTKDSTTTTTKTTTTTDGSSQKGQEGSGKGTPAAGAYLIDVQISVAGEMGVTVEPLERRNVQPLTPLPGEETPVVTYMGAGSGGAKAVFTVSKEVTAVYGEAKCVSGTETCEVLELEPGFPVTFVYGPQGDRYRIALLKIARAGDGS